MDEKVVKINDKVWLFGAELLPESIQRVISYMLKLEKLNNMQAVFISTTGPNDRYGEYCKHTRSFVISLPYAVKKAMEGGVGGVNVRTQVWVNIMYVIAHEFHHNVAFVAIPNMDAKEENEEEEIAHLYGLEMYERMIIDCEAEMPERGEFPIFDGLIEAALLNEMKNHEKRDWAREQMRQIKEGIVFQNEKYRHTSVIEYMKDTEDETKKYEKENPGALMEMTAKADSTIPNLFDQHLLPGQQGSLLPETHAAAAAPSVSTAKTETAFQDNSPKGECMVEDDYPCDGEEGEWWIEKDTGNAFVDGEMDPPDHSEEDDVEPTPPVVATKPTETFHRPFETGVKPVASSTAKTETTNDPSIMRNFWRRLATHMFEHCGFSMGFFSKPQGVFEPMALTPEEKPFIVSSKTLLRDGYGHEDVKVTGVIRGQLFKDGNLPAYEILVAWGNKTRTVRLIAQNPNKNSRPAAEAKAGNSIAWVIDVEGFAQPDGTVKNWVGEFRNGVYKSL